MMKTNLGMTVRNEVRRHTRLIGTVKYLNRETEGRIVDLSANGVAIDLAGSFLGAAGSRVRIDCEEIGSLEGVVRWMRDGRVGIEFRRNSNAAAQVTSYFRFFHKDIVPVMRG